MHKYKQENRGKHQIKRILDLKLLKWKPLSKLGQIHTPSSSKKSVDFHRKLPQTSCKTKYWKSHILQIPHKVQVENLAYFVAWFQCRVKVVRGLWHYNRLKLKMRLNTCYIVKCVGICVATIKHLGLLGSVSAKNLLLLIATCSCRGRFQLGYSLFYVQNYKKLRKYAVL